MPRPIAARSSGRRNSGRKPPRRSTGSGAGTACSTTAGRPSIAGSPGARLNTCWNALDRHVAAGRGDRVALIWDSPVTGQIEQFTYRELRDAVARLAGCLAGLGVGQGRPRPDLHADGARGGDGDARLRPHRRGPLGRVRRVCRARARDAHRRRQAAGDPVGLVRHRGQPHHRLQAAARCRDRRGARQARALRRSCSGRCAMPNSMAGRDHDWHELVAGARPADCVPVLATDPLYILYTSGTTGIPKGVVRDNGGHAVALHWSLRNIYGVTARRGVLDRFRCRLGGRPFLYRLRPAAARLHHGHVRGQAGRHPRCRRLLAGHRGASGARLLHRAHRVPRDQARGPGRQADPRPRSQRNSAPSSSPASAPTRRPSPGPRSSCGVPVIDHWWQTETGWPIAANCLGIERLPVKHGSARARCRAGTCACSMPKPRARRAS